MNTRRQNGAPRTNSRECKCALHNDSTDNGTISPKRLYNIASRPFPRKYLDILIAHRQIGPYAKFICDLCVDRGRQLSDSNTSDAETNNVTTTEDDVTDSSSDNEIDMTNEQEELIEISDLIDDLMSKLQGKSIDDFGDRTVCDKLTNLISLVGEKFVRPNLKKEYDAFSTSYKSVALLSTLDSMKFLSECNNILVTFLSSVIGRDIKTMDHLMLYRFSVCIETIYHLKNSNLILPHCFVQNLIQRTISGSRTVTDINGKTLPAASDPSYQKWLSQQGSKPLATPEKDIDVYIDNIGKYINKSYRVSVHKNRSPTVVTAVLNIPLQGDSFPSIQERMDLKPTEWLLPYTNEGDVQVKMLEILNACKMNFREYRFKYIDEILKFANASDDMETHISQEVINIQNAKFTRICDICATMHLPRKKKCPCGGHVSAIDRNSDSMTQSHGIKNTLPKYFHIGEVLNMNSTDLSLNEPIMENPNSFDSIRKILDTLKPRLIKGERKWIFIGADGPPYALMRRIISAEPEKYDWVVLVSGKGHLGMNQLKTFFKIIDKVFGEALGREVLNFQSDKSYAYFIQCKDTHKSWQALEVFLHGMTMELLFLYKESLNTNVTPTALGFLAWQKQRSSESSTLCFLLQLTFDIALAIYIQRVGDRTNDEKCSDAGRYKFFNTFFAFNHPIYREVEYHELRQKALFPDEISVIRKNNISFSTKNNIHGHNHEGGDFKLENQIQNIKALTPKGKKSEDMWRRVIRSSKDVTSVVQHGRKLLGLYDRTDDRITNIIPEIIKWRAYIRFSKYLESDSPDVKSINGEQLSADLLEFGDRCDDKRAEFWAQVRKGIALESIRYENIHIINEDNNDDSLRCYGYDSDSYDTNNDDSESERDDE